MGSTVSYSINANTKVPDSAWELVNYLTGPEGMARWTDLGLAMPSRPALVEVGLLASRAGAILAGGDYARSWHSDLAAKRGSCTATYPLGSGLRRAYRDPRRGHPVSREGRSEHQDHQVTCVRRRERLFDVPSASVF